MMELVEVVNDVIDSLAAIDASRVPFKSFQPGVGPYGEPQLLKLIAANLNRFPKYNNHVFHKTEP